MEKPGGKGFVLVAFPPLPEQPSAKFGNQSMPLTDVIDCHAFVGDRFESAVRVFVV